MATPAAPEHVECRTARLYPVFPRHSGFHTAGSNRIYVTHGRIPPNVHGRLIDALDKQKAVGKHTDMQTGAGLAQRQFRGS